MENTKFWVMIPVGFTEEHRDYFIESLLKINPANDSKLLSSKWEMLVSVNVTQIIIDTKTGNTVCTMVYNKVGTAWQLSSHLLSSITNIKNYTPHDFTQEVERVVTPKLDVDNILDKIGQSGYDSLSEHEKDYLKSLKK